MPVYQVLRQEQPEDLLQLKAQLKAELTECAEVRATYRNKVAAFMETQGVWHIAELDYSLRAAYQEYLEGTIGEKALSTYMKGYDRIKQYSIRRQVRLVGGNRVKPKYENQLLFLPYHPNQELAGRFETVLEKTSLLWDFRVAAPENMKRQIFNVLHGLIETTEDNERLRWHLKCLRALYSYCIEQHITDIEMLELDQIQKFKDTLTSVYGENNMAGIAELARKTLFMQADEINWKAHVWYLERFYFQPERINPSNPVKRLSFLEVTHKRNRELLKQYMQYGLGITNLVIANLRSEMIVVRRFLAGLNQNEDENVCMVTEQQMEVYFQKQQEKPIQAENFNDIVMGIVHFFNFLQVRQYIEKLPFRAEYYLKKSILHHHDRSVESEVIQEILRKLHLFPEELRLMFLHLWSLGLRISEVCTLKGNAYYIQGRDTWIQVYQIKMKNYKRVPIPEALYELMMVYLKRHSIGPDDYVFQNRKNGAYCTTTFRSKMKRLCAENMIQNEEYLFRSHDYRHGVATLFYENGVSLQGVRDYLGHSYEEMTQQYLDYIPRKIANKNDEYFSQHKSLASILKTEKR